MIHVTFGGLAAIYLALLLGPIFVAWAFTERQRTRRERAAFHNVVRCRICAFEFQDATEEKLPKCPRCGSLNEREPVSRI